MNVKEKALLDSVKRKIVKLASKERLFKTLWRLMDQPTQKKKIEPLLKQLDSRLNKLQIHADRVFPPNGRIKKKSKLP